MFYEYELSAILEVEKINQIFDAEIRSTFPTLQGFFWYVLDFSLFHKIHFFRSGLAVHVLNQTSNTF